MKKKENLKKKLTLYKINDNIDPFDGYLKKISQEEHFSFTESTWSNMEKRLNNNPKKINTKMLDKIKYEKSKLIAKNGRSVHLSSKQNGTITKLN